MFSCNADNADFYPFYPCSIFCWNVDDADFQPLIITDMIIRHNPCYFASVSSAFYIFGTLIGSSYQRGTSEVVGGTSEVPLPTSKANWFTFTGYWFVFLYCVGQVKMNRKGTQGQRFVFVNRKSYF
jgi:hypothetical protein